jgi:hypothetical protein
MFQTKPADKNETHILCQIQYFRKSYGFKQNIFSCCSISFLENSWNHTDKILYWWSLLLRRMFDAQIA